MDAHDLPPAYNRGAYTTAAAFRPGSFAQRFAMLNRLDPHFASIWLNYTGGLFLRSQLDVRTRLLVLTGQHTMLRDALALRDTIEASVAAGLDLKEVLEVILQCWIYAGESTMSQAVETFVEVARAAGRLEGVEARGLPVDATTRDRSYERERATWSEADRDDPRLEGLLERYGWMSPSAGLRLRPGSHINVLSALDALDDGFAQLWLDKGYGAMYIRGVLDDRTRLLCMVGDCLAIGETHNGSRHMRGALRQGASPAEVFEVVVQSFAVMGSPRLMGWAIDDFVTVLEDEGLLEEFVDPAKIDVLRKVVAARLAKRSGVAELTAADGQVDVR